MSLVGTLRHWMLSFTNLANMSTGAIGQTCAWLAIVVGETNLKAAGSLHLTLLLARLTTSFGAAAIAVANATVLECPGRRMDPATSTSLQALGGFVSSRLLCLCPGFLGLLLDLLGLRLR